MGVSYDTDLIRRSARRIQDAGMQMNGVSSSCARLVSAAPGALQGETGDVLEDILSKLKSDTGKIGGGLNDVANKLFSFASYLDYLDREASRMIQGN